jgi:hypothetical protein
MSALERLKALPQNEMRGGAVLTKPPKPSFVSFGSSPPPPFSVTEARQATADEAAELRRLLEIILADEPDEIAESLAIACADPDAALMSFRALVADIQERERWARS